MLRLIMAVPKGMFAGAKNPAWRGGHKDYRGYNWSSQRKLALERDGHRCVKCGKTKGITVHHKIPFRLFATYEDANELSNLETLCRKCHTDKDNRIWPKYPLFIPTTKFPDCRLKKICDVCGKEFIGASAQRVCNNCRVHKCDWCGKEFISKKRKEVRFCSRECNVAFRKSEAIYPRKCIECGTKIQSGRYRCHKCYLKNPTLQVRPGRKPGRKPKDHPAI
ncbi:MAG: HNH endonuclease [Deltaproteobacteria bacterium]|nr:MAG: HNH endonuclease [Deltaproteobacteria bacterium]